MTDISRKTLMFANDSLQTIGDQNDILSPELISTDLSYLLGLYLDCLISPIASLVGFVANVLSSVVLYKSGLDKPSNIILLALAIADILSTLFGLNIAQMLLLYGPSSKKLPLFQTWEYERHYAYVTYIFLETTHMVAGYGMYLSVSFPVLITVERLLAVYLPLRFSTLVSPKRTWLAVICVGLFWAPWCSLRGFWFRFTYNFYPQFNTSSGGITSTEFLRSNQETIQFLNLTVFNTLSTWVPIVIVGFGCVAILVKVKIAQRQRRQMASGMKAKKSKSRTTKVLVSVMLVFIFIHGTVFLSSNVRLWVDNVTQSGLLHLLNSLESFLTIVNSGCNFFIYIAFNDKFCRILKTVFIFGSI